MVSILLVDDDCNFISSLERNIGWQQMNAYVCGTAYDGIQALEICRAKIPDIVLTDVRMPNMNGIDLARNLRESSKNIQIIFMSSYSDKEYLRTAIQLRAIDYIDKPVNRIQLTEVLKKTITELCPLKAAPQGSFSRTVEDLFSYISKHCSEDLSIEFLAEQVYLSPSYLMNLFKKETGKTINQVITEKRMEMSCDLLLHTRLSLQEISEHVGYTDPRHFSKLFKRYTGKTPGEYRR